MRVLRTAQELAQAVDSTGPAVLVPTMGALHAGHAALIAAAAEHARRRRIPAGAMVTIFVNPTQFNNPADLARYPRTLKTDLEACQAAGAASVFAPTPETVYPPDAPIPVPPLPPVATEPGLEDRHRPGHFAGVAQVVRRLFDLCRPASAVFGEKDWQQLRLIAAITSRDQPQIEIIPSPTVREPDGLAMSSRNVFLTPTDRARALAISRALTTAGSAPTPTDAEADMRAVLSDAGIQPEYAVVRDAATLGPCGAGPKRALIAAPVGPVRLIDNQPWPTSR